MNQPEVMTRDTSGATCRPAEAAALSTLLPEPEAT
jgi:hypothetical protein